MKQFYYKRTWWIPIILLALSSILLVAVIFWIKPICVWHDFALGISANLIGIIITMLFVQRYFDEKNDIQKKQDEIDKILRFHSCAMPYIQNYIDYASCVVIPFDERTGDTSLEQIINAKPQGMKDMFKLSLYTKDGIESIAAESFFRHETNLKNYFISMLQEIDFKYNEELKAVIIEFVDESITNDAREGILKNMALINPSNKKTIRDTAIDMLADKSKDWIQEYDEGKLNGNILFPFIVLFNMVESEASAIQKYLNYIEKLEKA